MPLLKSSYNKNNISTLNKSRYNYERSKYQKNQFSSSKSGDKILKNTKDWFPSSPYCVIIDNKRFCANIKINKKTIHFHLVSGYHPNFENSGSERIFNSHFRHLVVYKKDIFVEDKDKRRYYHIFTTPSDWHRFWARKDYAKKHFWDKYNPSWDPYNWYVDWILEKNKKKLKEINKDNYLSTRSEGEEAVSRALKKLNLRYIPEYYIPSLKEDKKKYRLIDFYLPKENIFIEFNGGVTSLNPKKRKEELVRYAEKDKILKKNGFKVINVYPRHLSKVQYFLAKSISSMI